MKISNETIKWIYEVDYITNHLGTPALKKKYGFDLAHRFYRLGLKLRNHQDQNRKFTCNSDYFKEIDSEEKAYWLGFMMGDGYITKSASNSNIKRFGISVKNDDKRHLEKFLDAINGNMPIHTYEVKTSGYKIGTKYCRVIISDNAFAENIIKQGCVENKSNILEPPNIDKSLRKHWIRGYMDANGSISISKMKNSKYGKMFKIRFIGTENVLKWIQSNLIEDNVIKREYPFRKRKEEHIVTQFEFGGNLLSLRYLDYIYDNATVWLDRKYNRYLQLDKMYKD